MASVGGTVWESQDWFRSCKSELFGFCFYSTCSFKAPKPLISSASGEKELQRCLTRCGKQDVLKPKMSPVSGQGRKPRPVWTDIAQSQAAPASRFVPPRAFFLPATCDHWTFATWPTQLRRFILNNFNFKWKKFIACFNEWKKTSCFQKFRYWICLLICKFSEIYMDKNLALQFSL